MRELRLTQHVVDEIITHARADVPNECCGILGGKQAVVTSAFRVRNTARSPVKYLMDQQDQAKIMYKIDTSGDEIVAFYHSHTKSEAYPSITDINQARLSGWVDQAYLIISLKEPENPVIRAFYMQPEGSPDDVEEAQLHFGG